MDIDQRICSYIISEWISQSKSNRSFAIDHNIDEKTVRKIIKNDGYSIPVNTLHKICDAREISLAEFFSLINA
jgi:DNA-binding Xre family transcriptional regulator